MNRFTPLVCLAFLLAEPAHAAFSAVFSRDTLTLTQLSNGGDVKVTHLGGGEFQLDEGMNSGDVGTADNLVVVMLDGSTTPLEIQSDAPLAGSITLRLGAGTRAASLHGEGFELEGDLVIEAGDGLQSVEIDGPEPLLVGGDFVLEGVNEYSSPTVPVSILGDFEISMGSEVATCEIRSFYVDVARNFTFTGSDAVDIVALGFGPVEIGGNVTIDLGDGGGLEEQLAWLRSPGTGSGPTVGGKLTVSAGSSAVGDHVTIEVDSEIAKGIRLALGEGANAAELLGTTSKVSYTGGSGVDFLSLGLSAPSIKAKLGAGNDTLSLLDTLAAEKVTVDYGDGVDTQEIEAGTDVPELKVKNLP